MSVNIPDHFVEQFTTNVGHLLQTIGGKMRPYVDEGSHTGESAVAIDQFGAVEMQEVTSRFAPMGRVDMAVDRVWVYPTDYDLPQMIDTFDKARLLLDPTGMYTQAAVKAHMRKIDTIIFDAFFADAKTGKSGGTTTAFDTAFKALQEDMTGIATAVMEAEDERSATAFDEWKGQNAEGFQNAARLMANVGVNEDQLEGILSGDKAKLYDFLANVAKRSAEGKPIDGETKVQDFAMSPEAARAKRSELLSNKDFMERYTHTSQNVREPAMKEMEALTKIISASKDKS